MSGGGKLRSDWNRALLEDVVVPAYALGLQHAAAALGATAAYWSLWPALSGANSPYLAAPASVFSLYTGFKFRVWRKCGADPCLPIPAGDAERIAGDEGGRFAERNLRPYLRPYLRPWGV